MDKTRDSTNSKIWLDSTCAISVRRKGQILLVVESLVLSTTCYHLPRIYFCCVSTIQTKLCMPIGLPVWARKRCPNRTISVTNLFSPFDTLINALIVEVHNHQ